MTTTSDLAGLVALALSVVGLALTYLGTIECSHCLHTYRWSVKIRRDVMIATIAREHTATTLSRAVVMGLVTAAAAAIFLTDDRSHPAYWYALATIAMILVTTGVAIVWQMHDRLRLDELSESWRKDNRL